MLKIFLSLNYYNMLAMFPAFHGRNGTKSTEWVKKTVETVKIRENRKNNRNKRRLAELSSQARDFFKDNKNIYNKKQPIDGADASDSGGNMQASRT